MMRADTTIKKIEILSGLICRVVAGMALLGVIDSFAIYYLTLWGKGNQLENDRYHPSLYCIFWVRLFMLQQAHANKKIMAAMLRRLDNVREQVEEALRNDSVNIVKKKAVQVLKIDVSEKKVFEVGATVKHGGGPTGGLANKASDELRGYLFSVLDAKELLSMDRRHKKKVEADDAFLEVKAELEARLIQLKSCGKVSHNMKGEYLARYEEYKKDSGERKKIILKEWFHRKYRKTAEIVKRQRHGKELYSTPDAIYRLNGKEFRLEMLQIIRDLSIDEVDCEAEISLDVMIGNYVLFLMNKCMEKGFGEIIVKARSREPYRTSLAGLLRNSNGGGQAETTLQNQGATDEVRVQGCYPGIWSRGAALVVPYLCLLFSKACREHRDKHFISDSLSSIFPLLEVAIYCLATYYLCTAIEMSKAVRQSLQAAGEASGLRCS